MKLKMWKWCNCVFLMKTHRYICDMTYFDHHVTSKGQRKNLISGKSYMKRFLTSCSATRAWLRSCASLSLSRVTHLIRARWVTAARFPLPHWRKQSRPCRHPVPAPAVYSPAYLAAFARFANKRLIVVGKFERNVKYHLSMSSKLGFRVPRWKRNDTFLRAFVKILLFFVSHGLCSGKHCQRQY